MLTRDPISYSPRLQGADAQHESSIGRTASADHGGKLRRGVLRGRGLRLPGTLLCGRDGTALDDCGSYRRVRVFTVAVSDPPDWLEDLAVQLGADCAGG